MKFEVSSNRNKLHENSNYRISSGISKNTFKQTNQNTYVLLNTVFGNLKILYTSADTASFN